MDASRATTPVEDIETFHQSRQSLSPGDTILFPIGKLMGYLDEALRALTLHTEACTSFITYASSFLCSSYSINHTGRILFSFYRALFPSISFLSDYSCHSHQKNNWEQFQTFSAGWTIWVRMTTQVLAPSLLKQEYVASCFIAQASYETAAQLRISLMADFVTRVFMLFRGIRSDDVGLWAPAAARATAEDEAMF